MNTKLYELTSDHIEELRSAERGVTVISPKADIGDLLQKLQRDALTLDYEKTAIQTTTGVIQNFRSFSDFKPRSLWVKTAEQISRHMQDGFEKLGANPLFCSSLNLNDLTLQCYPPSAPDEKFAISPHRDQSGFINLVVVLLIHGPAAFFICKDRDGATPIEPIEIPAKPGDLIVMRGGGFGTNLNRPCHFVGRVDDPTGRMSLALRQLTNDREKLLKLEQFFGRKFGPGAKVPH